MPTGLLCRTRRSEVCSAQTIAHSPFIKCLKLFAPNFKESGTFVWAHQRPVFIILHTSHEQIRDPKTQEEVPSSMLFGAGVLPAVEELENVGVPRLQVNGKCTWPLKQLSVQKSDKIQIRN